MNKRTYITCILSVANAFVTISNCGARETTNTSSIIKLSPHPERAIYHIGKISSPDPNRSDGFGCHVAFGYDGMLLIGAQFAEPWGGCIYVADRRGDIRAVVTNPEPAVAAFFGASFDNAPSGSMFVPIAPNGRYVNGEFIAGHMGRVLSVEPDGSAKRVYDNPHNSAYDQWYQLSDSMPIVRLECGDIALGAVYGAQSLCERDGRVYIGNPRQGIHCIITNPAPESLFGAGVVAMSNNNIAITAQHEVAGRGRFGVVYIYDCSGAMKKRISNPSTNASHFGTSIARISQNRLLVGSYDEPVGSKKKAGCAYIVSDAGVVERRIENPYPAVDDIYYGVMVASSRSGNYFAVASSRYSEIARGPIPARVYVYSSDGMCVGTIEGRPAVSRPESYRHFPCSMALSDDERIAIGSLMSNKDGDLIETHVDFYVSVTPSRA